MITRFAPTPSGYLHEGNVANALIASWLTRREGGRLQLRIDDMDPGRTRDAYITDVFDTLQWLGITWEIGPRSADEVATQYSFRHRTAALRGELTAALDRGLPAYACGCSRADLGAGLPTGGCPRGCRDRRLRLEPDVTALRVHVPAGTLIDVAGTTIDLAQSMGDFVVWRRDDVPAYQLASVVADRDIGVTHVVRGEDLLASTAAQLYLAPYLDATEFMAAVFLHHPLLTDDGGTKLSKSQRQSGAPLTHDARTLDHVTERAVALGAPIGITPC